MRHDDQYLILAYLDIIRSVKQYVRAVNTSVTASKLRMYIFNSAQNLVAVSEIVDEQLIQSPLC